MSQHSTTQTFGPYDGNQPPALVNVKTNGGSLTITSMMESGDQVPVEDGVITADASFNLNVANGRFTFTPAGGCVYEIEV